MQVIRDSKNKIIYKLTENKLYNTTIVRDNTGKRVATIHNKTNTVKTSK